MVRCKKSAVIPRFVCIWAGVILLCALLVSALCSSVHIGHAVTFAAGVGLILFGAFINIIPRWIKAVFYIGCIIACAFVMLLLLYGSFDSVSYTEDAIILLGSGIKGEIPTEKLCRRLDAAVEYHKKNPDALIVVSGGMGDGETITEALAMKRYLNQKGVEEQSIIMEDKASSTYENFTFSKELLDAHLGKGYSVAFITSEYHIYRSGEISAEAGIDNATHLHSSTPIYDIIPSTIRECLAVIELWLF